MGTYCALRRLTQEEVAQCVELRGREQQLYELLQSERGDDWTDIDKAWHGIHFLLNTSASEGEPPLDFLLRGGAILLEQDWKAIVGIGLPDMRVFSIPEVNEISTRLSSISDRDFRAQYNPDALSSNKVYPWNWETRESFGSWLLARYLRRSVTLNYLAHHFRMLKGLLAGAVERDLGLVIKYHQ